MDRNSKKDYNHSKINMQINRYNLGREWNGNVKEWVYGNERDLDGTEWK